MATSLRQRGARAILVVDNCPPDLHRQLTTACRGDRSTLSLITIEYDIRDDQPEGTEVVRMEAASVGLVAKLVQARHPEASASDVGTISRVSEGNARLAFCLAGTIAQGGNLGGLSDEDLFIRLFQQRHPADDNLLAVAEACSLFYSFHSGMPADEADELGTIAGLAGTSSREAYRAAAEIMRRDLMQTRGPWRALLPHAVANRLARRALQNTRIADTEAQVLRPGSQRLLRSFSRRLGYLHDSPEAAELVGRWLSPGSRFTDFTALDDLSSLF